jgi:hypothetical protein
MAATEKTKEILESIDRLVAEEQNKERLAEIQVSLEVQGTKLFLWKVPIFISICRCVCAMQLREGDDVGVGGVIPQTTCDRCIINLKIKRGRVLNLNPYLYSMHHLFVK